MLDLLGCAIIDSLPLAERIIYIPGNDPGSRMRKESAQLEGHTGAHRNDHIKVIKADSCYMTRAVAQ